MSWERLFVKPEVQSIFLDFQRDAPDFDRHIPIYFEIGGINLVGAPIDGQHTQLTDHPAGFAVGGLVALHTVAHAGWAKLDFFGTSVQLEFRMVGSDVEVRSAVADERVRIDYTTLFYTWAMFMLETRDYIVARQPHLRSYHWWLGMISPPGRIIEMYTSLPEPYSDDILSGRAFEIFTKSPTAPQNDEPDAL